MEQEVVIAFIPTILIVAITDASFWQGIGIFVVLLFLVKAFTESK